MTIHDQTAQNLGVTPVQQRSSLSRLVAEQLEQLILNRKIEIGQKLPTEAQLCDQFGVSRTVIREAVAKLKSLGLVETRRGSGTTVKRNAPADKPLMYGIKQDAVDDILHILELRISVEKSAAAFAAERRSEQDLKRIEQAHNDFLTSINHPEKLGREEDFRFHLAIAQASKNPLFVGMFEQLSQGGIPRAKLMDIGGDQVKSNVYLTRIASEHQAIFDAIRDQDADAASSAMKQHLCRALKMYEEYKQELKEISA